MSLSDRRTFRNGFTLLEVLITVAIVGVLAAIALPAYSDYVMRSKIIDGTMRLGDARAQVEKFFLDNRTYVGACAAIPAGGAGDAFTVSCVAAPTATTYTLQAVGIAAKGMSGFTYTVDQQGTKNTVSTAWGPVSAGCWTVRKDGSCQ